MPRHAGSRCTRSTRIRRWPPALADDPAFDPADPDGGGVATLHAPARTPSRAVDPNDPATWGKVARNAACPCGSGKKFKHCHGRV